MPPATSVTPTATAEADSHRVPARRPLIRAGVETTGSGPAQIFQGYDSVAGIGLSTAVDGTTQPAGARSEVTYTGCETIETLTRALQIDQSLSVGFGPFGSVDEKTSFVYDLEVTTTSVSIVCYARHEIGTQVQTSFALERGIQPPKTDEELVEFFKTYGDSFLSSVTMGGEYYGVYVFYTQTTEEQSSLVAELEANGIWSNANVDASLQVSLDEFAKSTTTRWDFRQSVSGIANPELPNQEDFVEYAMAFPSKTLDAPTIIAFDTLGYERVPGMDAFEPIAKNRTYFIGFGDDKGLTNDLVALQEILNQDNWIKGIYQFYGGYSDPLLSERSGRAEADISEIDDQMVAFEDNPIQTFDLPKLKALGWGAPVLQYDVGNSNDYGGNGGDPWDDVDILTALQEKTWLSALQLRSGEEVDCLLSTYKSEESEKPPWETTHGGNGGSLGAKLQFLPGQFVVKVSGRDYDRVDRLDVEITDGRQCVGGKDGGEPFDWSVQAVSFVLGFAGRSKSRLDQIRVVYASFKPADWPEA